MIFSSTFDGGIRVEDFLVGEGEECVHVIWEAHCRSRAECTLPRTIPAVQGWGCRV